MIAANAALLTFVLGLLALTAMLSALLARRALGTAGVGMAALEESVTKVADATPAAMIRSREQLKQLGSATERALWHLTRFDRRVEALRSTLADRTGDLDRRREGFLKARSSVERIKYGARLLIGAIRMRRTILG